MAEAWRIVKFRHARTAFSGMGAALGGGRWNPPGVKVVYASATRSLAILENLVHLNPPVLFRYVCIRIEFDDSLAGKIVPTALPRDWWIQPPPSSAQKIGYDWIRSGKSVVLAVPSAIVWSEWNFLLNPAHPDFKNIRIGKPEPFIFDSRLF
jgi:RES domain-containing protein